jgi:hypothetical protein
MALRLLFVLGLVLCSAGAGTCKLAELRYHALMQDDSPQWFGPEEEQIGGVRAELKRVPAEWIYIAGLVSIVSGVACIGWACWPIVAGRERGRPVQAPPAGSRQDGRE